MGGTLKQAYFALLAGAIIGILLLTGGCGGSSGGAGGVSITGIVADDGTLDPIGGAMVTIGSLTAFTLDNGSFAINGAPAGAVTVYVTKDGYEVGVFPVMLGSGTNNIGTLYLKPTLQPSCGNVSGTVQEGSAPVAGAILDCGGVNARSKADGTFTVYNVPEGEQLLWAQSADGLKTGYRLVDVQAGSTLTGQVVFISSGPPPPPFG